MESTDYTVFINTNLDTRLALVISNNDSVLQLKQKIMAEHLNCFPNLGKINVNAVKVERRKCFYQLSDSVVVKSVFGGINGTWFLCVDAVSQVVSRETPLHLEPGSCRQPNLLVDGPSAKTQKTNIQLDHQSVKVSVLDSNSDIANHVILNEGGLVQGERGGQASKTLGKASQLKSPVKKKQRKGKKSEDFPENVIGPSGEADVVPENLLLEKPLGDEQVKNADLAVKQVESLVSGKGKEKKKSASTREEANSTVAPSEVDLKRKLSEASLDTEAKDVGNTRKKKKMSTKISDGENGLSSSGAGKDDSTRGVVPVASKREKALDADHPSLETKKPGKRLPPTGKSSKLKGKTIDAPSPCLDKGSDKDCPSLETKKPGKRLRPTGKSSKLKGKTIDAPSPCLDKGSDKDYGLEDNSVNMESLKTPEEQKVVSSKELNTSTDENKKRKNPPLKKVKKSRIGKATSDNDSSKNVPEDAKAGGIATDSPSQVQKNNEHFNFLSDILEHYMEKSHVEENHESGVDGSTDEDPKSSAVEGDGINFNE